MSAAIVMSWMDSGCPHRLAAFSYCKLWWRLHLPWLPIVIGMADPFSRAAGINDGIEHSKADVIFQPDPDTLIDPLMVVRALRMAEDAPGVVNPYSRYLYLNQDASDRIMAGQRPWSFGSESAEEYGPFGSGLAAVYSRLTWEEAGRFDERFGVWAGDDGAFAYAAGVLVAPGRRVSGDAYHLWHPRHPDSVVGSPGYMRQFAMLAEYRDAHTPDEMRAVIERRYT